MLQPEKVHWAFGRIVNFAWACVKILNQWLLIQAKSGYLFMQIPEFLFGLFDPPIFYIISDTMLATLARLN